MTMLRENFVGSAYTHSDNICSHFQSIYYWKRLIHNQLSGLAPITVLAGTKATIEIEPEFALGLCR